MPLIKNKIKLVLKLFRCGEKNKHYRDIPYIYKYCAHQIAPELQPENVYQIFEQDQAYGKFLAQRNQIVEFLDNLRKIVSDTDTQQSIENYKYEALSIKSIRYLKEFQPLLDFYKSYFAQELKSQETLETKTKKAPGQKPSSI